MFSLDPHAYGPQVADLLADDRLCELRPGRPNSEYRQRLRGLSVESVFGAISPSVTAMHPSVQSRAVPPPWIMISPPRGVFQGGRL